MKILFTGGSSFTGYWFVKELIAAKHEVVATFQRQFNDYVETPRGARVQALAKICRPHFGVSFGDDRFLDLIKQNGCNMLCHHAAETTNYKSSEFNVAAALESNTRALPLVLDLLQAGGCTKIVLTG